MTCLPIDLHYRVTMDTARRIRRICREAHSQVALTITPEAHYRYAWVHMQHENLTPLCMKILQIIIDEKTNKL
ncbi:MAG: hypothetical protein IJ553_00835 [Alloprevotella sp.]|nr:hypothetical protein [Alloprevotella sp.]